MLKLPFCLFLAAILYFTAPIPSVIGGEPTERVKALVVDDVRRKLAGEVVDYRTGVYSMLHEGGFSDSETREYIRPILEEYGFSEASIVKYFNLFDPHYHGGEKEKLEERRKMVETLLN